MLILTLIKPNVDDYMQSKIDEGQNGKLVLHDSKMNSLEKKIEKLKSENSLEKHIKNSKRKFFIGLNSSVESFEKELLLKFKKTTVRKYTLIAAAFVNYIFVHTNCTAIEEVKQADISKFITSVRYDELNRFEVDEIRKKLNNYLEFLEREQGNNSKH